MPESALGFLLKKLREYQKLTLRDVAQRGGVDHAYVYRLETGDKESPSDEVMKKLCAALAVTPREAQMLRFLASRPGTEVGLVDFAWQDRSVTADELEMLATVVNRGARPDYATSLKRIRRILREEDDG